MAENESQLRVPDRIDTFVRKYRNILIVAAVAIIVVVGYLIYRKYNLSKKDEEAKAMIFMAEYYLRIDSFKVALDGNTEATGFLSIIDDYKGTKTANLAKLYAGLCYYNLNDYESAVDYLEDYSSSSDMSMALAYKVLGDAHSELSHTEDAASYYKKAVNQLDDKTFTPKNLKRAADYLRYVMKDYTVALKYYERIRDDYPTSMEAQDVEKYIELTKALMKK